MLTAVSRGKRRKYGIVYYGHPTYTCVGWTNKRNNWSECLPGFRFHSRFGTIPECMFSVGLINFTSVVSGHTGRRRLTCPNSEESKLLVSDDCVLMYESSV